MALFLDLKVGETIRIESVTMTLETKSGQRARLKLEYDGELNMGKPYRASLPRPPSSTSKR